jgi:hypothetical protein
VLIAEDSRGVGQLEAMGSPVLSSKQPPAELVAAVEAFVDSKGLGVQLAVEKIRATHPKMLEFISQL